MWIYGKVHALKMKFRRDRVERSFHAISWWHGKAYLLFPLYDLLLLFLVLHDRLVPEGGVATPEWAAGIEISVSPWAQVAFYVAVFLALYGLCFRGVRSIHGCEHKLVAAAEAGDLANAWSYSPVHDRCGCTYLVTILAALAAYGSVFLALGRYPIGMFSFAGLVVLAEGKYFHKYNGLGLWVGRQLQRWVMVAEPDDRMLAAGVAGMQELVQREQAALVGEARSDDLRDV